VKRRIKNVLSAMGSGLQRPHAGEMLTNQQSDLTHVLHRSVELTGRHLPFKVREFPHPGVGAYGEVRPLSDL
jgi:uncharacterized protein (DUF2236 family)